MHVMRHGATMEKKEGVQWTAACRVCIEQALQTGCM